MQLQAAYDVGGVKIVDQYLTDNLMTEFIRIQSMLGEELMNNIHGSTGTSCGGSRSDSR